MGEFLFYSILREILFMLEDFISDFIDSDIGILVDYLNFFLLSFHRHLGLKSLYF